MIDVLTAELTAPLTEESAELYVGGTVFKTGPPAPGCLEPEPRGRPASAGAVLPGEGT